MVAGADATALPVSSLSSKPPVGVSKHITVSDCQVGIVQQIPGTVCDAACHSGRGGPHAAAVQHALLPDSMHPI
jgi:hypothetical protein